MTYPKKLSPEAQEALAEYTETIEELQEGESLRLKEASEVLDRFRYHLYAWLFLSGNREYYRVKRISPQELHVIRKIVPRPKLIEAETRAEIFVKGNLLACQDEEEALEKTKEAILSGELDIEEFENVRTEWRLKCGLIKQTLSPG